jgi:hypothetical protein
VPRSLPAHLACLLASVVLLVAAAPDAAAVEFAGQGFRIEVPEGYEPYHQPEQVRSLLARQAHVLLRPQGGATSVGVYVLGSALAPTGLLVVARVPTSEIELAGDLDAYERMLRRTPQLPHGVTLEVRRHLLTTGESALLLEVAQPPGRATGLRDARIVLAPNGPQHRTLLLWLGSVENGGAKAFGRALTSLQIVPPPDRVQSVLVWGTLGLIGLVLLAIVILRIRTAPGRGPVDFGTPSLDSMPTRALDGLPTFGAAPAGVASAPPGLARPGQPGARPPAGAHGAPRGLRATNAPGARSS